jgi:hypothetical protein
MSTPSGKPSHSIALSDHLVCNAREHAAAERERTESASEPLRSPYAPKRAPQRPDTLPRSVKNDPQSLHLVYDWKGAKKAAFVALGEGLATEVQALAPAQTSPHQRPATTDDALIAERHDTRVAEQQVLNAVQRAVEAARKAINESPLRVDELPRCPHDAADPSTKRHRGIDRSSTVIDRMSGEQLLDPAQSASHQPHAADVRQPAQPGSERRAKIVEDIDLENLEASLRWLQRRHAVAMRLPPAPNLPPRFGPVQRDVIADAHIGERTVDPFQSSLRSLEPTRLMPPPTAASRNPNTMLGVSIGCALVAGIVYYYLEIGQSSSSQATSQLQVASVVSRSTSAIESKHLARPEPVPSAPNGDYDTLTDAEKSPRPTATAPATIAPQQETMAMRSPTPAAPAIAAGGPSSGKATRTLDPENITLLVKEAEKHISTGDVVTARMIFQRAAEAGDATAALELAATYDPTVLAKLGVMGMGADVDKARAWYRMAESFGSAEAEQRLRSLDRQ